MTVETVNFIEDLDPSQPPGPDKLLEADDHLRNIKLGVTNSFPDLGPEAVTATAAQINAVCGRYDAPTDATQVPEGASIDFEVDGAYDISFNTAANVAAGYDALVLGGRPLSIKPTAGGVAAVSFDVSTLGPSLGYGLVEFRTGPTQVGVLGVDQNQNMYFRDGQGRTVFLSQIIAGLQAAGIL